MRTDPGQVKASNCLVDVDGTCLLADFGVSSQLVPKVKHTRDASGFASAGRKSFVGTPSWMGASASLLCMG